MEIEATVNGTGDGGAQDIFVPLDYKERPGLVLSGGLIYMSWSSHCDVEPYQGWVMSYDAVTLTQKSVYNVTANGQEASFWDGGAAPGLDAAGNLYLGAGNGTFDVQNADGSLNPAGVDLGESFIRLSTDNGVLAAADWFTPYNKRISQRSRSGHRLGWRGALRRGRQPSLDQRGQGRAHLHPQPRQPGPLHARHRYGRGADRSSGCSRHYRRFVWLPGFSLNSSAHGPTLYFAAVGDHPKAFVLDATGKLPAAPTSQATAAYGYPGSVPSISANAGANGIAWMLQSSATLHAYDADNFADELYNSDQNATRDALGSYVKFTTPIITQGRVYVGTSDHLVAYGLLSPVAATDVTSQYTATAGAVQKSKSGKYLVQDVTVTYTGTGSPTGAGVAGARRTQPGVVALQCGRHHDTDNAAGELLQERRALDGQHGVRAAEVQQRQEHARGLDPAVPRRQRRALSLLKG